MNHNLPKRAGIGLRHQHYQDLLNIKPDVGFLEVHPENYFSEGGASHYYLKQARENYPISLHGVGLSLGSYEEPDVQHMKSIKRLVELYDPAMVSEHISWNTTGSVYLNDLLPLPYTEEALQVLARNVGIFQDYLGCQVLLENPSAYLKYNIENTMDEPTFIRELIKLSGCGLLLDVNNIYVTAHNMNLNAQNILESMPLEAVQEVHLAGHAINEYDGQKVCIDDHGSHVCDDVWNLYSRLVELKGSVPTLLEWDTNIPEFNVLVDESKKAQLILDKWEKSHAA